jgi:hypothetical protein
MDEKGHQSHTAPVYISVNEKPVRASAADASFFIRWIDNILTSTAAGGSWNKYFSKDLDMLRERYTRAKMIYERIKTESDQLN